MKIVNISDLNPGNFMTEQEAQQDQTFVKKTANLSNLIYKTNKDGKTYSDYQNEPNVDRENAVLNVTETKNMVEAVFPVPDDMSGYPKDTTAMTVLSPITANPNWIGTVWIMSSGNNAEGGVIFITCGSNPPNLTMKFNGADLNMNLTPNQTTPILVPMGCRIQLVNMRKAETTITVFQGVFYLDQTDKPYA